MSVIIDNQSNLTTICLHHHFKLPKNKLNIYYELLDFGRINHVMTHGSYESILNCNTLLIYFLSYVFMKYYLNYGMQTKFHV